MMALIKRIGARCALGLADFLNAVLLGNTVGRLHGHAVLSIREKAGSTLTNDLLSRHPVHAPEHFDFSANTFDFPDWMRLRFALEERSIFEMRNALAYPRSGGVVSATGRVLIESLGSYYKAAGYAGFSSEAVAHRFSASKQIRGEKLIVAGVVGYYHWMLESLPCILRCRELFPDYCLLLPTRRPRYVDESLAILFGDSWRDGLIESDRPVRAERVAFYAKANGAQWVHPEDARLLREKFLGALGNPAAPKSRERIYVSRKAAKARHCDETALEARFRAEGFSVVQLEHLSLREQISLIQNAERFAGLHGAGFSHGVFLPPGARILELFRYDALNDTYARLLRSLGYDYSFLVSHPGNAGDFQFPEVLASRFFA